jgi:O-methyltransferase involved in polyketide biosynthesis
MAGKAYRNNTYSADSQSMQLLFGVDFMARRIESKTSRTAEFTCLARVLSYMEKRVEYKSNDYISLVIVNSIVKILVRIPPLWKCFLKFFPVGMYEYVIARTKYIDTELTKALQKGVEQVLIFGAGFDSRGIRFNDISKNAKIFELDVPVTQSAKITRYHEKGIKIQIKLRGITKRVLKFRKSCFHSN